jgi:hypothetical protein
MLESVNDRAGGCTIIGQEKPVRRLNQGLQGIPAARSLQVIE